MVTAFVLDRVLTRKRLFILEKETNYITPKRGTDNYKNETQVLKPI